MRTGLIARLMLTLALLGGGLRAADAVVPVAPPRDRSAYGDPAEYEVRDRAVVAQDLQILERAAQLLNDESAWNRADDRQCKDDEAAGRRSLFCALQAASIEVLGSYDHRRVALQEVRFAIEEVAPDREFNHRLMDFNNLPTTTLAQVQEVLRIARQRVQARLADPPST
jgi:hypothetical protein